MSRPVTFPNDYREFLLFTNLFLLPSAATATATTAATSPTTAGKKSIRFFKEIVGLN